MRGKKDEKYDEHFENYDWCNNTNYIKWNEKESSLKILLFFIEYYERRIKMKIYLLIGVLYTIWATYKEGNYYKEIVEKIRMYKFDKQLFIELLEFIMVINNLIIMYPLFIIKTLLESE